jgi:hypothetical protein
MASFFLVTLAFFQSATEFCRLMLTLVEWGASNWFLAGIAIKGFPFW